MDNLELIPWFKWLPSPWRKWQIVLIVENADEVPREIPNRGLVLVGSLSTPKWLALDCPCRKHRIFLNLDRDRKPVWILSLGKSPSLYPSVITRNHNDECHFWLKKGKIVWFR